MTEDEIRDQAGRLIAAMILEDDDDRLEDAIRGMYELPATVTSTAISALAGMVCDLLDAHQVYGPHRHEYVARRYDLITRQEHPR